MCHKNHQSLKRKVQNWGSEWRQKEETGEEWDYINFIYLYGLPTFINVKYNDMLYIKILIYISFHKSNYESLLFQLTNLLKSHLAFPLLCYFFLIKTIQLTLHLSPIKKLEILFSSFVPTLDYVFPTTRSFHFTYQTRPSTVLLSFWISIHQATCFLQPLYI